MAHRQGKRLHARVLKADSPLDPSATLTDRKLVVQELLAPLHASTIKTIRGLGTNFPPPVANFKPTPIPILFYKPLSTLNAPQNAIVIPKFAAGKNNDYETELCVVIGKECKDVSVQDALSYVHSYTVVQDVRLPGTAVYA